MVTTPATEALDAVGAKYEFLEAPGAISGEDYANAIGADKASRLYKTLVMQGEVTGSIYVFIVPALAKLAQRKAAKALGEHALSMLKPIELMKETGYKHGGCSPLGMKNQFRTIFDSSVNDHETVLINGGGGGYLVDISMEELGKAIPYEIMDLQKQA